MPFKSGDVARNLLTKGFVADREGHHTYFYFHYKGRRTHLYTFISHGGSEDVGDDNVRSMKRQLGLQTMRQVRELVECSMDETRYVAALTAAGVKLTAPTPPKNKGGSGKR